MALQTTACSIFMNDNFIHVQNKSKPTYYDDHDKYVEKVDLSFLLQYPLNIV